MITATNIEWSHPFILIGDRLEDCPAAWTACAVHYVGQAEDGTHVDDKFTARPFQCEGPGYVRAVLVYTIDWTDETQAKVRPLLSEALREAGSAMTVGQ